MNGHVLRRRSSNEFSSTVLTTGIVLPAVMGCPRRHTSLKLVGGKHYPVPQLALGALRRWRHHAHRRCRHSLRAAARWRPTVMPLKPSRLAMSAMVRPCWRRRIAWARSSSVKRWLRSSPACPRSR